MVRTVRGSAKAWANLRKRKKPRQNKMACYEKRDDRLSEMGYANYGEYLASEQWREIRGALLARYPHCVLCEKRADQVHHLSYDAPTLLGLTTHRLVTLCDDCHGRIECDGDRKRGLREANRVLFSLAEATTQGRRWIRRAEHEKNTYRAARKRARKQRKNQQ